MSVLIDVANLPGRQVNLLELLRAGYRLVVVVVVVELLLLQGVVVLRRLPVVTEGGAPSPAPTNGGRPPSAGKTGGTWPSMACRRGCASCPDSDEVEWR